MIYKEFDEQKRETKATTINFGIREFLVSQLKQLTIKLFMLEIKQAVTCPLVHSLVFIIVIWLIFIHLRFILMRSTENANV